MCGRRTTHKCYNLYSTVEMLTTRDGPAVIDAKARYLSKIAIFLPQLGPPGNIAITFGMEKLEWCGCPMVEKTEDKLTRFDRIHERYGQTDGRMDRQTDTIMTAYAALMHIIARQKNDTCHKNPFQLFSYYLQYLIIRLFVVEV